MITFFVLQYSFPCLFFSYERDMLRCNLRFCFSSFLTFFVLLMFLYLLPSEHIAKSLIPKSIPIPSLDGTVTESSYSMPTVIHQFIPSYLIRGLLYLQSAGIRLSSASLIQFIFCLFFFLEIAKPSIFTCVSEN